MKKLYTLFIAFLILLTGCITTDEEESTPELTQADRDVIAYFKEIAFGYQNGGGSEMTRKWNSDMRLFIGGNPSAENLSDLNKIRQEINGLATDGFSIEIVTDSAQSNAYIYFGTVAGYAARYPTMGRVISLGYFNVYWEGDQAINHAHMFLDTFRANAQEQKTWLLYNLTASIGLADLSPTYPESVFTSGLELNTSYTPIDKELIRLLYHPRMQIGLDQSQAEAVLEEILLDEKR
ncbi:DUF2927 domain-containing protein [Rufibacter roseolus]|uniref:DUF2927 domain-containing protein n=1 Tax=Rufibacter roseolus TaxID=2817375 RepID=UPI001B3005C0|nr:DUF2927 domain-containing protein [Rufibacter roseolus]